MGSSKKSAVTSRRTAPPRARAARFAPPPEPETQPEGLDLIDDTGDTTHEPVPIKTMCVRLKPYNPRAGYKLQRYTYKGIRIEEAKGWHQVPTKVSDYLAKVRNDSDDEHSPLAFDVMTLEEAKALNEREYRAKVERGLARPGDSPILQPRDALWNGLPVTNTGDVTTADLRPSLPRETPQRSTRAVR